MFLNNLFLDYAEFVLGYLNWGFSKKGVGNHDFGQKQFQNFDWAFVPFVLIMSVLARCGNFNLYLGIFSHDHAFPTC